MIEKQFKLKHYIALSLIFIAIILSGIQPLEFEAYLLHQVGTVFMLVLLFIIFKKIGLDFLSFSLYLLFLLIHIIGAHYLYSYVPYNDWIQQIFHFNLDQYMGWSRNMYDRLVHLAYGVLLYPLIYRVFQVWLPTARPFTLFLLVIQFVMASSVFYELIEWAIAIGLSPEEAENYNGQQGDMWDAHKDMLLATIGAIIYGVAALIKTPKINHS
ncbi:DUF2238 domain-containing protein [Acinetobacter sp. IK31]|uniref:DUF2238 domain-containing protein n=1 Tax=Acinetobacter sp. IK31 TaxID=2928895 RepID=UPI002D1FF188|nr:DUF2238 domain-containing protein [Acinetobacter sp. IK31]MEB3865209.1 DUF2238 domain-containing protein [Acinetobacter sp. IK31]